MMEQMMEQFMEHMSQGQTSNEPKPQAK
jgi:hypothetical protein